MERTIRQGPYGILHSYPTVVILSLPMNRKGFTLIELVMILVLIGILAAVVVPRLGNVTTTNATAFVDKLRADIRYAQNLAMTRGKRTRIVFSASSYTISRDSSGASNCSAFTTASDPASGGNLAVVLNTGKYAGITIGPSRTCLEYDSLGRPYDCTLAPAPAACSTSLSGMTTTVIANGVTVVGTVTITTQTGAVN